MMEFLARYKKVIVAALTLAAIIANKYYGREVVPENVGPYVDGAIAILGSWGVYQVTNAPMPGSTSAPPLVVLAAVLGALVLLGGCASMAAGSDPQSRVAAVKKDATAVLLTAKPYVDLPFCAMGQKFPKDGCSDPRIVVEIAKAVTALEAVLDAAETTVRSQSADAQAKDYAIAAAVNALKALRTVMSTYGVFAWASPPSTSPILSSRLAALHFKASPRPRLPSRPAQLCSAA